MNPLITPNQLEELVNTGADILICDCRFDLTDPQAGRAAYNECWASVSACHNLLAMEVAGLRIALVRG